MTCNKCNLWKVRSHGTIDDVYCPHSNRKLLDPLTPLHKWATELYGKLEAMNKTCRRGL